MSYPLSYEAWMKIVFCLHYQIYGKKKKNNTWGVEWGILSDARDVVDSSKQNYIIRSKDYQYRKGPRFLTALCCFSFSLYFF
jgi:hypothetical protein